MTGLETLVDIEKKLSHAMEAKKRGIPLLFEHPDRKWIGKENVLDKLSTPALLIDLDLVEQNILTMARLARNYNKGLRPHTKSHKSPLIAKLQREAGAVGVCVATVGEAEVMQRKGLSHILLTSEVTSPSKIERIIALNEQTEELILVVDHPDNLQALALAAHKRKKLRILIDLDIGHSRAGVKNPQEALSLAKYIQSSDSLEFMGIQAYAGHISTIRSYEERKAHIETQNRKIEETIDLLRREGTPCKVITGGSTGSCLIDLETSPYTDLQVGSYVFMDAEYSLVEIDKETPHPFYNALKVLTTVISIQEGSMIVDAGLKAFASHDLSPQVLGLPPTLYTFMGGEHGKISWLDKRDPLPLGTPISCLPPHLDPTVNLYDVYHCMRNNTLIDLWPIETRGHH